MSLISWVNAASGLVLAALLGPALLTHAEPRPEPAPDAGVSFSGRVIEKETGKPVPGATIVVTRSLVAAERGGGPPWVGDTTLRTGAEGRFTIAFPREQVAEPTTSVALSRVEHPDFVPRKSFPVPLATVLQGRRYGEKPFFESIALERGLEFSGQVVTPDGRPAAGVPFEFENWGWRSNESRNFYNDTSGRTDAEGRIRLRMAKTHSLTVKLMPESYAPFQKFWGTDRPAANPETFAPTDIGRHVLGPGPVLSGRLLDLDGRPIADQRVIALGRRTWVRREATTTADGSFAFAPLRPGNYDVFAEGQHGAMTDPIDRPMPESARVIRPAKVYLREGGRPEPVELRELPAVRVEVRFVDSRGRPARGSTVSLSGTIPGQADRDAGRGGAIVSASAIDGTEPEDMDRRLVWSCQRDPDAEGLVVFRAPRGLEDARLNVFPPPETVAYKTRLEAGGALRFWGGGRIGTLDADRAGIEVIAYRAATVLARITTEDGEPVPKDAKLEVGFDSRGLSYGGNSIRQGDGRYRTECLMPDHDYEFSAWAEGYVPRRLERLNLSEGAEAELTLVLRKKPTEPAVGDPAPPFTVGTTDGRLVGLVDFRGKFLLLHAWNPYHGEDQDLPRLDAIRKRFGEDRLALLGLSLSADPRESRRVIEFWKIAWPQAILLDRGADPLILDYGGPRTPYSYLIGPDGTILARDLVGEKVDEAVAAAMGEN